MAREFLNRLHWYVPHRQPRTKRVAQDVDAMFVHAGTLRRATRKVGNRFLRHRCAVVPIQDSRPPKMSVGLERCHESLGQSDVADAPALRVADLALLLRAGDRHLLGLEVDVRPFQRHHLTAPEPGLATQQDD
jgi:hypothetical protein